jgi:hypothetical protein
MSFPFLLVSSLLVKHVHRAVPKQRLLYCRLFTQLLLANGSTRHSVVTAKGWVAVAAVPCPDGPGVHPVVCLMSTRISTAGAKRTWCDAKLSPPFAVKN